jgi:hypothetical protein
MNCFQVVAYSFNLRRYIVAAAAEAEEDAKDGRRQADSDESNALNQRLLKTALGHVATHGRAWQILPAASSTRILNPLFLLRIFTEVTYRRLGICPFS